MVQRICVWQRHGKWMPHWGSDNGTKVEWHRCSVYIWQRHGDWMPQWGSNIGIVVGTYGEVVCLATA